MPKKRRKVEAAAEEPATVGMTTDASQVGASSPPATPLPAQPPVLSMSPGKEARQSAARALLDKENEVKLVGMEARERDKQAALAMRINNVKMTRLEGNRVIGPAQMLGRAMMYMSELHVAQQSQLEGHMVHALVKVEAEKARVACRDLEIARLKRLVRTVL